MLTFLNKTLNLAKIVVGDNVRLESAYKIAPLKADILENGLQTPITVFELQNGEAEVIRGHRRERAVREISKENPATFKKLFPKGIPVTVLKGVSYEIAQTMKVDDSNYEPLSDPFEIQMCANKLFEFYGDKEKPVILKMTGILDRKYPPTAGRKKEIETLKADIILAKEKGLNDIVIVKQAELDELIFKQRRGKCQNMHAAFRCPDVVMTALKYKAVGTLPEGWDSKEYLPASLNYDQVKQLWKAFKADLDLDKEKKGTLKYNKRNPGPTFLSKWEEICNKLQEAEGKPKAINPKAMAAKAMKGQKFMSTGFTQLTLQHAGDKEVDPDRIGELDEIAYFAEIINERAPDEWKEFVKLATGLEKEIKAERQEVSASK